MWQRLPALGVGFSLCCCCIGLADESKFNIDTAVRPEIRLTPQIRRVAKADKPAPVISLAAVAPFLPTTQILSSEQLQGLPFILMAKEGVKHSVSGQLLYVEGELEQNRRYGIYRQGELYTDPQSGDVLGYEAVLLAEAKVLPPVVTGKQQISRIEVQQSRREVKQGDRLLLLPQQSDYPDFFQPRAPQITISALIAGSTSPWREFGQGEVVLLNRGLNAELKPGHLLGIFHLSSADRAGVHSLPAELVGQLMVVSVSERSSFAIIVRTKQPVRVGDLIANL